MSLVKSINNIKPQIRSMGLSEDWKVILYEFYIDGRRYAGIIADVSYIKSLKDKFISNAYTRHLLDGAISRPEGEVVWDCISSAFDNSLPDNYLFDIEVGRTIEGCPRLCDSLLDSYRDTGEFADNIILTDEHLDWSYLKKYLEI